MIVNLVFFSHLGFWNGIFFSGCPFPDLCLLVLFSSKRPIFQGKKKTIEFKEFNHCHFNLKLPFISSLSLFLSA